VPIAAPPEVETLCRMGHKAAGAGNYDYAVELFLMAVRKDYNCGKAWQGLMASLTRRAELVGVPFTEKVRSKIRGWFRKMWKED